MGNKLNQTARARAIKSWLLFRSGKQVTDNFQHMTRQQREQASLGTLRAALPTGVRLEVEGRIERGEWIGS